MIMNHQQSFITLVSFEAYQRRYEKFFSIPVPPPRRSPITAGVVAELGHQAAVFCTTPQVRSYSKSPFEHGHNYQILHEVVPHKHPVRPHPFYSLNKYIS